MEGAARLVVVGNGKKDKRVVRMELSVYISCFCNTYIIHIWIIT